MNCGCGGSGWNRHNNSPCGCGCMPDPCATIVPPIRNCPSICGTLTVQNSWNVPACDAPAILMIPGLKNIQLNGYLWNPAYGYFKVTGFDSATGQVTIVNTCLVGNATPGTTVGALTDFQAADGVAADLYRPNTMETWNPTLSGNGAMTITGQTVSEALYFEIGNHVWFRVFVGFTVGGTPDSSIYIPLPTSAVAFDSGSSGYICTAEENMGTDVSAKFTIESTPRIKVFHSDASAWAAGAGANIGISAFYEKA